MHRSISEFCMIFFEALPGFQLTTKNKFLRLFLEKVQWLLGNRDLPRDPGDPKDHKEVPKSVIGIGAEIAPAARQHSVQLPP